MYNFEIMFIRPVARRCDAADILFALRFVVVDFMSVFFYYVYTSVYWFKMLIMNIMSLCRFFNVVYYKREPLMHYYCLALDAQINVLHVLARCGRPFIVILYELPFPL